MSEATKPGRRPRWAGASFGTRLQHGIFYLFIHVGGRWAAYALLRLVVAWYMLFRPDLRRRSIPYLRRRFPGRSAAAAFIDSYRHAYALGQALIDRAVVGILGPSATDVGLDGKDELLRLAAQGKGLVLVTAHVGCWQASFSALGFLGMPVNMLLRSEAGEVDRQYFEHAKAPCPYKTIDPEGFLGGTLEMIQALKKGEAVCIMGDRVLGSAKNAVAVDFLGGPVLVPISPYKIAAAAGAPIGVLFSYKSGYAAYRLELAAAMEPPSQYRGGAEVFRPQAEAFAAALADFTQRHPYQFFNFFDMWSMDEDHTIFTQSEEAQ